MMSTVWPGRAGEYPISSPVGPTTPPCGSDSTQSRASRSFPSPARVSSPGVLAWRRPQPGATQTAVSSSSAVARAEADAVEAASLSRRCARSAALAEAASRSIRSVSSRIRASLSAPVKPVRPNLASRASCDTAILPSTVGPEARAPGSVAAEPAGRTRLHCFYRSAVSSSSSSISLIVDLVDPLLEPFTGPLQPDAQIEPLPILPHCGL